MISKLFILFAIKGAPKMRPKATGSDIKYLIEIEVIAMWKISVSFLALEISLVEEEASPRCWAIPAIPAIEVTRPINPYSPVVKMLTMIKD